MSIWISFLSAIVGGILVLAGQSIDRRQKQKQEALNNLREIYAYCRRIEALMKNYYRELAMAKIHVEYWWFCYRAVNDGQTKMYYDEHLKSQGFAREIERKIGESKADFIAHVRKFQAIKSISEEIEHRLLAISNLSHPKASSYNGTEHHDVVRFEKVEQDEKVLREKLL
jgi:hypothetical protein